jgi:hypothetical protein
MTTLTLAIITVFAIIIGLVVSALRWRSELDELETHERRRERQHDLVYLHWL